MKTARTVLSNFSSTKLKRKKSRKDSHSPWMKKDLMKAAQINMRTVILEIMEQIQGDNILSKSNIDEILCTLEDIFLNRPMKFVANQLDSKGNDLMYLSAAKNYPELVEFLLNHGYSNDMMKRACKSPVHVACMLGNLGVLKKFIKHGVDLTFMASVCFCSRVVRDHSGAWGRRSNLCACTIMSPLDVAISKDRVEVCQLILNNHPEGKQLCSHESIKLACSKSAEKCLAYLLRKCPEVLHDSKNHSMNQSIFSLAFSKSLKCGRILLQSGIAWTDSDLLECHDEQSLLHVIYKHAHYKGLQELTQLAFASGFKKSDINHADRTGVTPFLVLIKNAFTNRSRSDSVGDGQERVDSIIETIEYLATMGANMNAQDKLGKGAIHYLMMQMGKVTFTERSQVLSYLLKNGVDVNACSLPMISTPIISLTYVLCSLEAMGVESSMAEIFQCYKLMCDYGADVNVVDPRGINPLSLVLTSCNRWLRESVAGGNTQSGCRYLHQIKSLVQLFLEHGYNPSPMLFDFHTKQISIMSNIYIQNEVNYDDILGDIRNLMVPFFHHCYNPNELKMVIHQENDLEPCTLHAQFYISRAFIIHKQTKAAFGFFSLFENILDQKNLNNLILSICKIFSIDFPQTSSVENTKLIIDVQALARKPRSLRQLTRISIAKALKWNLLHGVGYLPLPTLLKRYILDL